MPKKGTKIVAEKKCIDFKSRGLERLEIVSRTMGWTYCEAVERGLFALKLPVVENCNIFGDILASRMPKSDHGLVFSAVGRIVKRMDSERRGGGRENGRGIQRGRNHSRDSAVA
jgi:hypothetical protein